MDAFITRIVAALLAVILQMPSVWAQPTVYLVRHAEKIPEWLSDDLDRYHPLSEAGMARAQKLAGQFEKGSLAAIFSSPTTRTLHTVQPLAHKLWLQVEIAEACYDTSAMSALLTVLQQRYKPEEAVLLVSHSHHLPHFLIKAGLPKACWRELGLVAPEGTGEIMIEGYENIWKIARLGETNKGCEGFSRRLFKGRE